MTTQFMPDQLAHPPPLRLELIDADRTVGWIIGDTVGFRGFSDATEAAHAAWIAYRTLARRLARTHGTRPVPIDTEPLTFQSGDAGEADVILASDRPIAVLLRPAAHSRSGDSFGFELVVPPTATELQRRGMAYLIYRTLRKSGVRWAMWRPEAPTRAEPVTETAGAASAEAREAVHRVAMGNPSATAFVATIVFVTSVIVLSVALIVTAPPTVTAPLATALLLGLVTSRIVVAGDRWLTRRRRRTARPRGLAPGVSTRRADGGADGIGAWVWAATGGLSVSLLVLSLLVDEGIGTPLAAIGLAGLAVFRLAAMAGGWVRRVAARGTRPSVRRDFIRAGTEAPEAAVEYR